MLPSNPRGRPTKLTDNVLAALKTVLETGNNAMACTDEELFVLLNSALPQEERISYRSYQRYKAMSLSTRDEDADLEPLFVEMSLMIKRAFILQKGSLLTRIADEEVKDWRRYAWMLERKSKHWRMPAKGYERDHERD